jgi:hypothetical protein
MLFFPFIKRTGSLLAFSPWTTHAPTHVTQPRLILVKNKLLLQGCPNSSSTANNTTIQPSLREAVGTHRVWDVEAPTIYI